jgi:hypothetical protein
MTRREAAAKKAQQLLDQAEQVQEQQIIRAMIDECPDIDPDTLFERVLACREWSAAHREETLQQMVDFMLESQAS